MTAGLKEKYFLQPKNYKVHTTAGRVMTLFGNLMVGVPQNEQ
jgi:hypothetical protein